MATSEPPGQSSRSVGGSCRCGSYCLLLCTVFKFLLSVILTLGVIVVVMWLIFGNNEVKVYVEKASLSRFNLSADGTLSYNLTVDVSVRNPNRRISIYYDYVEARAFYDCTRFDFTELPPFFQGHKNTTVLHQAFQGRQLALGSTADTYNREKGEGFFYVGVKIHTRARLKVWFVKTGKYTHDADCTLRLPVPGNGGGSAAVFTATKCDLNFF